MLSDVTGETQVTVIGPSAAPPASLTLDNFANDVDLGIENFNQTLTVNVVAPAGDDDALDVSIRGFTGTLTTPGVETLNFSVSLSPVGNAFTIGNQDPDTYSFTGSGGFMGVTGLDDGDVLRFVHHDSTFTITNAALDQLELHSDDSFFNLLAPGASFSSFSVTLENLVGNGSGINLSGITMDGVTPILVEGAGTAAISVGAGANIDASAATGNVRLINTSATGRTMTGGQGDDRVLGGDGADTLSGGPGGLDELTGNGGNDIFAFNHTPTGVNVSMIWDFTSGSDTIQLKQGGAFTQLAPGALGAGDFTVVETLDLDAAIAQHVIFETSSGNLYYNPTSADASDALAFANVDTETPLLFSDITVVA
jgi:Ca2+-binding RTX toxin-like protein